MLLNKPYGVLCQFSAAAARPTLPTSSTCPDVYPAGRLDADSEGLVVLTADGALQARIAHPRHKLPKTYWVQVEGEPAAAQLAALAAGVALRDGVAQRGRRAHHARAAAAVAARSADSRAPGHSDRVAVRHAGAKAAIGRCGG